MHFVRADGSKTSEVGEYRAVVRAVLPGVAGMLELQLLSGMNTSASSTLRARTGRSCRVRFPCRSYLPHEGGGRVAIGMNGSPGMQVAGELDSGERLARSHRHYAGATLLRIDIATYMRMHTNRKPKTRKSEVQSIDATAITIVGSKRIRRESRRPSPGFAA